MIRLRRVTRKTLTIAMVVLLGSAPAFADNLSFLTNDKLSYPELEVVPRASKTLEMEAQKESADAWRMELPVQISALTTLVAAATAQPNGNLNHSDTSNFNSTKSVAIGIGVGWLALTSALAEWYRPYTAGDQEVTPMPASTQRQQIARERLAEQALYSPADLAVKLKWFSFISNLAANIAVSGNASNGSHTMLTIGALMSLAPLIFPYHWERVAEQHRKYMKRIYGPVASAVLMPNVTPLASRDSSSDLSAQIVNPKYSPGVELQWTF